MKKTKTKLYIIWRGMKERCTNPNHKNYEIYKDKLCLEWFDSSKFMHWAMQNGYKEGLTRQGYDVEESITKNWRKNARNIFLEQK